MKRVLKIDPPEWLNGTALEEWARVYPLIRERLTLESMAVFASYCLNYGRWRVAEATLDEHGLEIVMRDDKGNVRSVIPSPHIGISTKYHDRMLKSASLLGITNKASKSAAEAQPAEAFDMDKMLDAVN